MLFKILFQAVCKSQVDWGDPLDSYTEQQWAVLAQNLRQTKTITVERYYFSDLSPSDVSTIQIHGFSYASESAYGAVVYLRVETKSGNIVTKLVTSKSRVAPIKGETIPRLELMGAVVLAWLINSVQSALSGTLKFNDASAGWTLRLHFGGSGAQQRSSNNSSRIVCSRSTTCQARILELLSHRCKPRIHRFPWYSCFQAG